MGKSIDECMGEGIKGRRAMNGGREVCWDDGRVGEWN